MIPTSVTVTISLTSSFESSVETINTLILTLDIHNHYLIMFTVTPPSKFEDLLSSYLYSCQYVTPVLPAPLSCQQLPPTPPSCQQLPPTPPEYYSPQQSYLYQSCLENPNSLELLPTTTTLPPPTTVPVPTISAPSTVNFLTSCSGQLPQHYPPIQYIDTQQFPQDTTQKHHSSNTRSSEFTGPAVSTSYFADTTPLPQPPAIYQIPTSTTLHSSPPYLSSPPLQASSSTPTPPYLSTAPLQAPSSSTLHSSPTPPYLSSAPLQAPSSSGKARPTNPRTSFTPSQLKALETQFTLSPHIDRAERMRLSQDIGVGEVAVRTWFQNARARQKRRKTLLKQAEEAAATRTVPTR